MWKETSVTVTYMAQFLIKDLSLLGKMEELFKQMQVHEGELEGCEEELQYFLAGRSCFKLLERKLEMYVKIHGGLVNIEKFCEVLLDVDLKITTESILTKFSPRIVIVVEATLLEAISAGIPIVQWWKKDTRILKEFLEKPNAIKLAKALIKHEVSKTMNQPGDDYDVGQLKQEFENKRLLKPPKTHEATILWEIVLEKMYTQDESCPIDEEFVKCLVDLLPFFSPTGICTDDLWDLIEPLNGEVCQETYHAALRLLRSIGIVSFENNKISLFNLPRALISHKSRKRIEQINSNVVTGVCYVLKNQVKVKESLLLEIMFIWDKLKTLHKKYLIPESESLQIPVLIAQSIFQHGMYTRLEEYTKETVELFSVLDIPSSNMDFLDLRRWQGYSLDIRGHSKEGADILQSVYLEMRSLFGMKNEGTLNVATDYIKALYNSDQVDQARGLIVEILFATPMENFSDEIMEALCRTQAIFGKILAQASLEPAVCFIKESYMKLRKMCGTSSNLWTIETVELLGLSYSAHRDYDKALSTFKYALKLKQNSELLGEYHPETTISKFYVGMTYVLMNNYSKAMDYLIEAHMLLHESFGPGHEHFIVTQQLISVMSMMYQANPNDRRFLRKKKKKQRKSKKSHALAPTEC